MKEKTVDPICTIAASEKTFLSKKYSQIFNHM